jgi:hypothetical protein
MFPTVKDNQDTEFDCLRHHTRYVRQKAISCQWIQPVHFLFSKQVGALSCSLYLVETLPYPRPGRSHSNSFTQPSSNSVGNLLLKSFHPQHSTPLFLNFVLFKRDGRPRIGKPRMTIISAVWRIYPAGALAITCMVRIANYSTSRTPALRVLSIASYTIMH